MPEKRSNKVLSISSVDTQEQWMSSPDAERECSMAALVAICGGKVGVYSPMIAIDRFKLPLQPIIFMISRRSRPTSCSASCQLGYVRRSLAKAPTVACDKRKQSWRL